LQPKSGRQSTWPPRLTLANPSSGSGALGPWLHWAARLIPALTTEAVIAWLDARQPDPGQAAERIGRAVHGAIQAAGPADP
jgi:hypothetical protein